jgi:glucan phosphoethanolaminetransferase (alkaline phosphatase superfamily)
LTVDSISTDEHTVFGAAVPLAVSLAMILTAVAYTTVKRPKPRFYPTFLWMTIKHGFFALGVIVTFAVFWQRVLGSILVPLAAAVIILGLVAGVVAAVVNYMTIMESHLRSQSGSSDAG